eukprot:5861616-Pyramimonas_sp.AAC.1
MAHAHRNLISAGAPDDVAQVHNAAPHQDRGGATPRALVAHLGRRRKKEPTCWICTRPKQTS